MYPEILIAYKRDESAARADFCVGLERLCIGKAAGLSAFHIDVKYIAIKWQQDRTACLIPMVADHTRGRDA